MSNKNENIISEVLNIFRNEYNKQVILYGPPGTGKTYYSTIIAANLLIENHKGLKYEDKNGEEQSIEKDKIEHYENNPEEAYEKAKEFLEFIGQDYYQLVQFHPSYNYDDFVRGIKMSIESNQPVYEVVDKLFGDFAKKAAKEENKEKNFVLVIDEINRAPLASVLGELIYGLEYRGRKISTPYAVKENDKENDKIVVPDNLYIIGTMNTADRSIGSIDYAVRRRFAFVPVRPDWNVVERSWEAGLQGLSEDSRKNYTECIRNLWTKINGPVSEQDSKESGSDSSKKLESNFSNEKQIINYEDGDVDFDDIKIGHSYFLFNKKKIKEDVEAYMNYRLKYEIKPILHEYRNDGLITNSKKDIDDIKFGNKKEEK